MFVRQAAGNLRRAIVGTGSRMIASAEMSANLSYPGDERWAAPDGLKERLEHVIGVERFARAYPVSASMDAIREGVRELLRGRELPESFRISASRADKAFPVTSPDMNVQLGDMVRRETGMKVDLEQPGLNVHVLVRAGAAYLSLEEFRGLGGMPVGVSGNVVALLSGGIDSPVAAFQTMLRGCHVTLVHFHSFPLVAGTSREKAKELAEMLTRYQFFSRMYLVSLADIQKRILVAAPQDYRVVLYRRFMLRIAEALALEEGALALVTGDSVGQVSSQTLENMLAINAVMKRLPVLRPFVTADKEEIVRHARRLGTYETSIQPDEDCCSLFVPPHPVTRATPELAAAAEASLDVDALVREAIAGAERWEAKWPRPAGER
ncbi:MAG: tRNA 4-thiouridine(8) synthase ThiI [Dehalococcoidia bacterium]|nr:tRNA 4-thiouridine(8) synthase ThiI [Dehalococcoidia bacterium]